MIFVGIFEFTMEHPMIRTGIDTFSAKRSDGLSVSNSRPELNRSGFTGELLFQMLGRFLSGIQGFIEVHLCFFWRDVSDFAV